MKPGFAHARNKRLTVCVHSFFAICLALLVSGCGGDGPKQFSSRTTAPKKATSRPYQIKGIWYRPQQHYEYSDVGVASWYGKRDNFHGKKTATGEVFNTHRLTAAHKTLPLPCVVRVTNLENGRSLILKVNDRGPFKPGRIIDISEKGAQMLGFYRQGTARVRVDSLVRESLAMNQAPGQDLPVQYASAAHAPVVRAPYQRRQQQARTRRRTTAPPILQVPSKPVLLAQAPRSLNTAAQAAAIPETPIPEIRPEWGGTHVISPEPEMALAQSSVPIPSIRPGSLAPQEIAQLKQDAKELLRVVVPDLPEQKLGAVDRVIDGLY